MAKIEDTNQAETSRSISFEDLFDVSEIQKIQDQFAAATGVASLITRPDGTPITAPSNFCRLCNEIIRKTEKGRLNCFKSDASLGRSNPSGPIMQPCLSGGLWDGGAGISVGGVHVANWLIGQVRNETQSDERMLEYADTIGADRDEFRKALAEVPIMWTAQFREVCNALFLFANQLSQTAYQNLRYKRLLAEREAAERALARTKGYIDNIVNSMPSILVGITPKLEIILWNQRAEESSGLSVESAVGKYLTDVLPQLGEDIPLIEVSLRERRVVKHSGKTRRQKNRTLHEDVTIYPLETDGVDGAVIRIDDVTEHIEIERQLAQSRKMDAVGQLAGGIAHDFNNMLGGILGAAELLADVVLPAGRPFLDIILNSADRASKLTANLLAFSRKGTVTVSAVDMHGTVKSIVALLERSLDKRISIHTDLAAESYIVMGDEPQLHSALLNIGINAGHAMQNGGDLTFTTQNTYIDREYSAASSFDLKEGHYLEISVRDTGVGIPFEVLPRIFEPFFTTKEQGKGTGLGLSAAWGTISEHHGAITVYSEEGNGTLFRIYLPTSDAEHTIVQNPGEIVLGSGLVFVVDDEESIVKTATAILTSLNYRVISASDGEAALRIYAERSHEIDVVLLDMIMPKMNGLETFLRIKAIRPDAKIIISSGFSKDEDLNELKMQGLSAFIRKPYRKAELSRLLAEVLNPTGETDRR